MNLVETHDRLQLPGTLEAQLHEFRRRVWSIKMMEAGCTVIGGHSIRDPEIKFGYAVTGTIDPKRVLTNSGAKAGDALLFTKAIGTGVISTAIKRGIAQPEWIEAATRSMTTLNKVAAVWAPWALPANSQFLRPMAMCLSARSATLLSMSKKPSSR